MIVIRPAESSRFLRVDVGDLSFASNPLSGRPVKLAQVVRSFCVLLKYLTVPHCVSYIYMDELSSERRKRIRMETSDPVLAGRIKELRNGLRLLQVQFAEKLGVNRTQVVAWENGARQQPTVEKLLEMVRLALTAEGRVWFWRKAGVDLEALKADPSEEVRLRTNPWESGQALRIPVIRELSVDEHGELLETEDESVSLPAERFSHPASIVCLKCAKRDPWISNDGDLVIVDRSVTDPDKLLRRMTVVFFDPFPVLRRRGYRRVPSGLNSAMIRFGVP